MVTYYSREHQHFCISLMQTVYEVIFEGKNQSLIQQELVKVVCIVSQLCTISSSVVHRTHSSLFLYDHISYYQDGNREGSNIMVSFQKLTLDQQKKIL